MTAVKWPFGVRASVLINGYEPGPPKNLTESPMERGHKLRKIATGTPEIHKCRLRLPFGEYLLFKKWVTELFEAGNSQFMFPHPETGEGHICQFIPNDGRAYQPSMSPGKGRFVDFEIRIYPN